MMRLKQLDDHSPRRSRWPPARSGRTMPRPRRRRQPPGRSSRPTRPAVQPLAPVEGDWWRLYDDPVLDGLVADALAANTDVRVAVARLARARAALREVKVDRLPEVGASASATRGRDDWPTERQDQLRRRARRRL